MLQKYVNMLEERGRGFRGGGAKQYSCESQVDARVTTYDDEIIEDFSRRFKKQKNLSEADKNR